MKKIIIFIILVLFFVVAFAFGFFSNNIFYQKNILSCSRNYCYNQGWEAAKQYVNKSFSTNDTGGMINAKRNFISGKTKEIVGDKIFVEYRSLEILPDQNLLIREVSVTSDTDIKKLVQKNDEAYKEELDGYKESIKKSGQLDIPENYPSKYVLEKASFSDLKVGQDLYIQAAENIQDQKSFVASSIEML
jgi:hypothetical protein